MTMHIVPGRQLQAERVAVRVLLDFEAIARATVLVTQIGRVNPMVQTPADVMTGAVTVGLNRLLSEITHTDLTLRELMVPMPDVDCDEIAVPVEAADVPRIACVRERARVAVSDAAIVGAALRTGLAMLTGHNVSLGPLFRIVV